MCWCSRIVGVARLLFESNDYFVQHFWRCSNYSRAVTNRERRLIEQIWYYYILSPNQTLSKRFLQKIIFGSTWGDNFYMSTQNGSKYKIWWQIILIHALELKLWPFEVSPYVCIGKALHLQCFQPTRAHKRDDLYPIWSKREYRLSVCIVWLYYAASSSEAVFRQFFFSA